jgi:toxin FitB
VNHVVYDTNIASLAVKGRMPATLGARLLGAVEVITFVTAGELIKWSDVRSWGARQRGALDAWLSQRPVIDSTDDVWRIWGRLAGETHRRGAGVSENDIWIAACCLSEGLPLVTRNVKDFVDFADHHGLVLITD